MATDKQIGKIKNACGQLYLASKSIRILTHVSWPGSVREKFFAQNAKELPEVEYPTFDMSDVLERLVLARSTFRFSPIINEWLNLIAYNIETSAKMLAACGTGDFHRYSGELYGVPKDPLCDAENTSLDLAMQFDSAFEEFQGLDLGAPENATVSAEALAEEMRTEVARAFGDQAPDVQVVDELSANALAGPSRIRIRNGAIFTDRDVRQLIHHEAHIHVGTSLNGIAQDNLRVLAASHPGTTKTQEGLAVFAEFITGSMDLDRFRRLADRVIAIQMAIDGADFLQVYEYFLNQIGEREQAFESTRRVFRGGLLTGGAPFTKDIVYLDGLIRVHNFLRTMVAAGRADCLRLLFCGKMDLEDLPVIGQFAEEGICFPPVFLPPWATDIRFLLCYLTYSSFLNRIDLKQVKTHYAQMLDRIPPQSI
ncbi:MAG: flavohemoglobin expression-modulating QEGLA motif protein [Mariniblastus sp.]